MGKCFTKGSTLLIEIESFLIGRILKIDCKSTQKFLNRQTISENYS